MPRGLRLDIVAEVRAHGGLAATRELHTAGFGRTAIALAVRNGRLVRIRQGWYGESGLHPSLVRAARVGGRATCTTALDLHGVWVVSDGDLHVAVPASSCQHRRPGDKRHRLDDGDRVRRHWTATAGGGSRLIVDPVDALRDVMACAPPHLVGVAFESLLHERRDLEAAIRRLMDAAPRRLAPVLASVDGRSESGTEFLFRWRMRGVGAPIRVQVAIRGVGRVDFLIGDRLVVEVDGWRHHGDRSQFETDRRRDAVLSALGYRSLRFSYEQVMDRWGEVDLAVRSAIARGDHR